MTERLKDLFGEAAELPAAARAPFLDAACGDDERLRAEVDDLLRAHDVAGDFLSHPTALVAAAASVVDDAVDQLAPGDTVDGYRLVERLGRGGSASVWRARQQLPVERDVALKVLHAGSYADRAADRFVAECHALARMQHPAIAKVFDAGTTSEGALWLAMELIDGEPVGRHCDSHGLSLTARLELFVEVCFAVQHAHTKGIVHRDLKPSNVLVTPRDGRAQPVVIDFGVASALHAEGSGDAAADAGDAFGTPEYMSPEQAALGSEAIDARTDVYSLGVLLYELVCGARPHAWRGGANVQELLRSIREDAPLPPSRRIRTPVPREIDWIVARAMAKDPTQRYPTAVALADDVRRLLRDEVVLACPATAAHRFMKFVRRHRVAVGAATAVVLSVAIGTCMAISGWVAAEREATNAKREAANAESAAADARREADNAKREAKKANGALELLDEIWTGIDPTRLGQLDYRVHDLLAEFERTLPDRARGEPAVELRVRRTLARLQLFLGSFPAAEAHATRAVELAEELDLPGELCVALLQRGRARFDCGEQAAAERDAIAAQEIAERHPDVAGANLAGALEMQANCRLRNDDMERAMQLAERALALRLAADEPAETARSHLLIANLVGSAGRTDSALEAVRSALACLEPLDEDDPDALIALQHLATLLQRKGDLEGAEAAFRESLERRRRVYGEDHAHAAWAATDLAWLLRARSKYEEAEHLLRHSLPRLREHLGEHHVYVSETMQRLGSVLTERRKFDEAETLLTQAVARFRTLVDHPDSSLAACLTNVARLQWLRGDTQKARATQLEALAMAQKLLPPDHYMISSTMTNLAGMMTGLGDREGAVDVLRDAMRRSRASGRESEVVVQMSLLDKTLRELGRLEEADALGAAK